MDQLNIQAWQGRVDDQRGGVSEPQAQRIASVLADPGTRLPGDVLPLLWHWCAFPNAASMEELGRDGHPMVGDFLPPVRLERRMWAGGALRFHAPLRVGERMTRQSTVRKVEEKDGPMVLVTVDHVIRGERGIAIEERQDIVYLPIPDSYTPPRKREMPASPDFASKMAMTETLLFRYSAITFNAHRIHYDLAYAREVEHYPGLVVHGPLQATLLMQAATQYRGRPPCEFHFRAVHPMFAGEPLDIAATDDIDGSLMLCTGQGGHQGMQATAIWQGTV
ncbi:MaoC family dehydratase N-terminal domain-containing protein [Lutimaribacter marinistellae]|uniref:MaoC family dehydratase N-terminal domain-containing protein n=1 Tax=Lutimaribacter marinistellae TaxID=1820329 RepID=A0ABV7TP06_9RHOB